ncbi:MAG: VanZ family protein [Clostridiales bacterium]|nr:VanZ family protein [Clostridiales bacterium]
MRFLSIFRMAKEYLLLGIIVVVFVSIGYFLIFKVMKKDSKKLSKRKFFVGALLLCYMVVVLGATMFSRPSFEISASSLHLFFSYKDAWNSFSKAAWRNIILNICMFIPLGFLLPLFSDKFKIWWKNYLVGLATTLIIELLQLVTHRGIFEIDDIINNFWGTMIGYGLIILVKDLFKRKDKRENSIWKKLSYQLPLLILIVTFSTIFIKYNSQEYGNLRENYIVKVKMSNVEVKLNTELKDTETTVSVYKLPVATQEETLRYAKNFFAKFGKEIDESRNDFYDETAIYYTTDGKDSIWIDYAGLAMYYSNHDYFQDEGKAGCSLDEIRVALKEYDIEIPSTVDFEDEGNGNYIITVNMYLEGDKLINGTLSCFYSKESKVKSVRNNINTYEKYKECTIISEQAAYEKIKEGKFKYPYNYDDVHTIDIESVELSYALDSKGFYQPVYDFKCKFNGEEGKIIIPAMKK